MSCESSEIVTAFKQLVMHMQVVYAPINTHTAITKQAR